MTAPSIAVPLRITIGFPPPVLWPNGPNGKGGQKAREAAKQKKDAWAATLAEPRPVGLTAPIPVHLTVYPHSKGPLPDADNCVAAVKRALDGISLALKLNDRDFAAPTVAFGPRLSRIEITLGPIGEQS